MPGGDVAQLAPGDTVLTESSGKLPLGVKLCSGPISACEDPTSQRGFAPRAKAVEGMLGLPRA